MYPANSINVFFQLIKPTVSSPFDGWHIKANQPAVSESFVLPASDDNETAWSVSLPGNMAAAQQTLAHSLDTIAQRHQAIGLAGQFLQTVELPAAGSFSLAQVAELTVAEAELFQILSAYGPAESFGLGDWLKKVPQPSAGWADMLKECQQFMTQAVALLQPTFRINTQIEHALLAQTLVRANGGLETAWRRGITPEQMALHWQTTHLTLATRQALAFFVAQVSAGAASLVARFYVTQWVALPAAFRFVMEVARRAQEEQLLVRLKVLMEK